ncbi:hypothetical protein BC939DRAFT_434847 [Gamsiella multidivaricata]|uniref:uncharacterized protein n=1 Tax=Gamsiella multidivaricata TaxID=101098 RepID=UPI0022202ECF|nr:uncharacterized protein BC939DRAFT_434847 [Gamsiella multidivaricata]KAI7832206.1 hypothetical protein BC939DRAFT_434847 [Gamsiella multidivaricata]
MMKCGLLFLPTKHPLTFKALHNDSIDNFLHPIRNHFHCRYAVHPGHRRSHGRKVHGSSGNGPLGVSGLRERLGAQKEINAARKLYGIQTLKWNDTLFAGAEAHVKTCNAEINTSIKFGEIVSQKATYKDAVQEWLMAESAYRNHDAKTINAGNSFSQIVGKSSTQIGCDIGECGTDKHLIVCRFFPERNKENYSGSDVTNKRERNMRTKSKSDWVVASRMNAKPTRLFTLWWPTARTTPT